MTSSIAGDGLSVAFTSSAASFTPITVTLTLVIKSGLENSYTGTTTSAAVSFKISELPAGTTPAFNPPNLLP